MIQTQHIAFIDAASHGTALALYGHDHNGLQWVVVKQTGISPRRVLAMVPVLAGRVDIAAKAASVAIDLQHGLGSTVSFDSESALVDLLNRVSGE